MGRMTMSGYTAASILHRSTNLAELLPDPTFASVAAHADSHNQTFARLAISRFIPNAGAAYTQILDVVGDSLPDGTPIDIDVPRFIRSAQHVAHDRASSSLPETTVEGMRQLCDYIGRLTFPLSQAQLLILPPHLSKQTDGHTPNRVSAVVTASYENYSERDTIANNLGAVIITDETCMAAPGVHGIHTWKLILPEGGHAVEMRANDFTPEGLAIARSPDAA